MTTKVNITCPPDSHWNLRVIAQDLITSNSDVKEWGNSYQVTVLSPGQTYEGAYVYDSRRLIIEEVDR